MSGPMAMPSGQAQVNLGECSLIRGAGRHRNSQPPFTLLLSLHQFVPKRGKQQALEIILWPHQLACHVKADGVWFLYRSAAWGCGTVRCPLAGPGPLPAWWCLFLSGGWHWKQHCCSYLSKTLSPVWKRNAALEGQFCLFHSVAYVCWHYTKTSTKWIHYKDWLRISTHWSECIGNKVHAQLWRSNSKPDDVHYAWTGWLSRCWFPLWIC